MTKDRMIAALLEKTIAYDSPDSRRIAHLVKVHGYARAIGLLEGLDEQTLFTLEAAAIVHDIGIKVCEAKYEGKSSGHLQEIEGPPIATALLTELGFDAKTTERVAYLVGHHHTYTNIQGIDYQILVESDFLVNLQEKNTPTQSIQNTCNTIFKTRTGKTWCTQIFGLNRYTNQDYGFI
ncbi:MAG: HD domain-containing protein [Spirochaetia bacterium]|nr:HD domain-containing protein [Spirochaetia bacterium]